MKRRHMANLEGSELLSIQRARRFLLKRKKTKMNKNRTSAKLRLFKDK